LRDKPLQLLGCGHRVCWGYTELVVRSSFGRKEPNHMLNFSMLQSAINPLMAMISSILEGEVT
jgi:hypothetical protein